MFKNGFLSIVVLFCCFFSEAQDLQIVKDPVLCNFGLKDAGGKWITLPRFIALKPFGNGYYLTFDGVKYGLLDEKGTEVLEPTYDELVYRSSELIYAQSGKNFGFINYKMEVVIPIEFTFFKPLAAPNGILLHKKTGNEVYSTIVDITGKTIMPLTKGAYIPANRKWRMTETENGEFNQQFLVADSVITYPYSGNTVHYGKLGLYDIRGKELLPRIYDDIQYRDENSCWIAQNGKIGAVRLNGKTIIEPVFYGEMSLDETAKFKYPAGYTPIILHDDNRRYGLMDVNGDLVLPVEYSSIQRTKVGDLTAMKLFFEIKQSAKVGYANDKGKIVIPAIYDTLIPLRGNGMHRYVNGQSVNQFGFLAECNDEYGVIGFNNETLIAIRFCSWMYLSSLNSYVLERDQQLFYLIMNGDSLQLRELKETGKVNQYTFFRINDRVIPFEKVGNEWKVAVYTEQIKPVQLFRFADIKNRWYDESAKYIGNYSYLTPLTDRLLLVQTVTYKRGVIRFPEQTFVLDTVYRSLTLGYGYLWATPFEDAAALCWQPYDFEGRKLSENCFSEVFPTGDTTYARSNNKLGVVKPDLTWLIPPAYQVMVEFGSSSWLVRGMNGGIGALDASGKTIADTIYTSIEPVFAKYELDSSRIFPPGEWWLLKRNSDSLLISSTGQKFSTLKDRKAILRYLDVAILTRQVLFGALNIRFEHESLREIVSKSTYKQRLLSVYRKIAENAKYCNSFSLAGHRLYEQERCSDSGGEFLVVAAGKSYYSYAIVTCFTHYSMEEPGDTECDYAYTNNVFYNGRWKELLLYDVFGKGDALLQKELQRAIQQLKDEYVPCYNPDQLVRSVQGFYLSTEGVHISISLGDNDLTLLIPKSRLSALTTAKWIVPLLN